MDESNRLEYVGNVVQAANLRLEELLVEDFAVGDLLGGLLQAQHILPGHEKSDELLAEVTQGLDFLILGLFLLGATGRSTALRRSSLVWLGAVLILVLSVGGFQTSGFIHL